MLGMFCDENATTSGVAVGTIWCPSDGSINGAIHNFAVGEIYNAAIKYPMRYTNYKFSMGYWMGRVNGYPGSTTAARTASIRQQNGAVVTAGYGYWGERYYGRTGCSQSPVRIADVTDGTSNTIAASEHAHGLLARNDPDGGPSFATTFDNWGWWTSGNFGDTIFTEFYQINPQRRIVNGFPTFDQGGPYVNAASSFHPGGVNTAMLDGSVRFIKDSIDSWQLNPSTFMPPGATYTDAFWALAPGSKLGIWQALGSRNGGEVISADQY
jgi:prepilin-type processing-associated H-X9-DG protein